MKFRNLLMIVVLVLCSLARPAKAEIAILLNVIDDTTPTNYCIVRESGDYFIKYGSLEVQESGILVWDECNAAMTHTTQNYRIVVTGNPCNGKGKAVLYVFNVATYTIQDRTGNGQD